MNAIIIIQLLVAFVIGIISLFIIYRAVNFVMSKYFGLNDKDNTSFTVFQMGIIIAGALILSTIIDPAINAIRILNPQGSFNISQVLTSLAYVGLFSVIGIVCTLVVIAAALATIFQLTKINEIEEMKNNKINASIIIVALIIGLSLIIDNYCGQMCETLIPYPEVLQIR